MKLKKLASIALISIPLYFFAANTAKADEFKLNLRDPTVRIDKDGEKKEPNVFNDFVFNSYQMKYLGEFEDRVYDSIDSKINEKMWSFTISQELEDFIYNPESAMVGMNDNERKEYMDKVNDEMEDIMEKELRDQAKDEFNDSEFYKNLKEKAKYYRSRISDTIFKRKIEEKGAYIDDEGGINLEYKKLKFKKTSNKLAESTKKINAELIIEEAQIDKQEAQKSKFSLKRKRIGVILQKDSFIFRIKTRPFHVHSWDYEPQVKLYLITKYGTATFKTEYSLKDNDIDTQLTATLPKGFCLYVSHGYDPEEGSDVLSTVLQKNIYGWTVTGSYSVTTDHIKDGTAWLTFSKTW